MSALQFKSNGKTYKGFAPLTQTHKFKENERVMVIWADGEISEVFVYEPDNATEDVLNRIMDYCDIQGPNDARVMLLSPAKIWHGQVSSNRESGPTLVDRSESPYTTIF